ncbi:glycosyltransferase [Paenibacillus sp. J22TS3]|uniref:GAP1-N2 domain-containing protein n=1 Tax=Paenibacillus sp. J22TS3 TaxID=2807192 RepID=UPI001AFF3FA6|nr:glycosyltransferase [Paenibacillus sp. J22TS3]GIP23423.1 hypothetical protein J22TS3_36980 [Paenibacillus sp. J22TS3]
MSHSASIQQQMYTRERRGIFRQTEGFDTVARSGGLEPGWIKKVLHPFCVYDAPAELTARGEKDGAAYPEAVHLFHTDNGDTVLGRSLFQPADFTGLRSAFFSHNYVIPAARLEELVQDYGMFLHADFARGYDIGQGDELPALDRLPVRRMETGSVVENPYELLKELKISEPMFKQLLSAILSAVTGGRKVYVALDVPAAYISEAALPLLELLYSALPHPVRRVLGFVSYAKEPQSRKGIHISFVERGSLRPGDRGIEKDYTFDLASGRVTNVDLDWTKQPYLDMAWELLGRKEQLEDFHRFSDIMLRDMGQEKALSIASYHELSVLYQVEGGNEGLYESHKISVLRGILEYLRPEGALAAKERLNDLFLARFDREFDAVKSGRVPDPAIAECIKDYYRIDPKNNERRVVEYFIRAAANARKEPAAFSKLNALIENHPSLRKAYFDQVLKDDQLSALLFVPYIEDRFRSAGNVREVVSVIQEWDRFYPGVWDKKGLRELARSEVTSRLQQAKDITAAAGEVLAMVDGQREPFKGANQRETGAENKRQPRQRANNSNTASEAKELSGWDVLDRPGLSDQGEASGHGSVGIMADLASAVRRILLALLDMEKLTKEALLSMEFIAWAGTGDFGPQKLDAQMKSKLAVLKSLYAWFGQAEPDVPVFDQLKPKEMDEVQRVGRRWLRAEIGAGRFDRLTLAFYRGGADDSMDYAGLVEGLRSYAAGPDTIYRFFQWSERQPLYLRGSKLAPAYEAAIMSYFRKHDRDAFKKRANWKDHFDKAGRVLKPVYERAKQELASPLARMFRGKRTLLFGLIVVLLAAGIWGTLQLTGTFDKKEPVAVVPNVPDKPVQQGTKEIEPLLPERAVYAEQVMGKDGKEATRLVFLFRSGEECRAFTADSVVVDTGDEKAKKQTLPLNKLSHSCAEKTSGNDSEGSTQNSGKTGKTSEKGDPGTSTEGGTEADKTSGSSAGNAGMGDKSATQTDSDGRKDDAKSVSQAGKAGTDAIGTGAAGTADSASTSNAGQSKGVKSSSSGKKGQDKGQASSFAIDPKRYANQVTALLSKAYSIPSGSRLNADNLEFEFVTKSVDNKE